MREWVPTNAAEVIRHVFCPDSVATDGSGKTALAFGDITAYYVRADGTLTVMTTETIATLGTWASTGNDKLGFKLMHDTNAPGLYELHLPNNIFLTGSDLVTIMLRATGMAPVLIGIPINQTIIAGAVDDGAASPTVFDTTLTEATADHFVGRVIVFTSGVLLGQARVIESYRLDAAKGEITVSALTDTPEDGATFVMF